MNLFHVYWRRRLPFKVQVVSPENISRRVFRPGALSTAPGATTSRADEDVTLAFHLLAKVI